MIGSIRQGDVLLIPVKRILDDATPVARDHGRVVLAYGEVTGHSHAIADPAADLVAGPGVADRYLRVRSAGPVDAWRVRSDLLGQGWLAAYQSRGLIEAAGYTIEGRETINGVILIHEEHLHPVVPAERTYRVVIHEEWTDAMEPRQVAD